MDRPQHSPPASARSRLVGALRRLKRLVHAASPALHDRLLALYRRAGGLRRPLEDAELRQRIDELEALVADGERRRALEPEVAARLRAYVAGLRREAQQRGRAGT